MTETLAAREEKVTEMETVISINVTVALKPAKEWAAEQPRLLVPR